jgi:ribosomal protein S18 acetylase RimI-like enzyme
MTYQFSLRKALPCDEPFLLELRKLTMTEHLQRVAEPSDDEAHYGRVRAYYEDAQIICNADEAIGLLKLTRAGSKWYLHQIQVMPGYQSKGIGRLVLGTVLAEAASAGVAVSLSVLHGNPARRLYERLGFVSIAESSTEAKLLWRP